MIMRRGSIAVGAPGRANNRRPRRSTMDVAGCPKCNTPLDAAGTCVTCAAEGEGLRLLSRSGYASVKEMMEALEGAGLSPGMEQVPAGRPEQKQHPLWNLYVPAAEVDVAQAALRAEWADLLGETGAREAADRGLRGVDLDAGGEIECPACGHRFTPAGSAAECPDCGLALGAPADAAPDEAEH
jgi:ssDNA-binding Zn-finger/Zn-ribbon topoisomerase 1